MVFNFTEQIAPPKNEHKIEKSQRVNAVAKKG